MIQKDTNEYLEFLDRIKAEQNSKDFKAILAIGKNGDILANSIAGDLNLTVITEDDILLYKINEVIVIASEAVSLVRQYEDYGYLVFVME